MRYRPSSVLNDRRPFTNSINRFVFFSGTTTTLSVIISQRKEERDKRRGKRGRRGRRGKRGKRGKRGEERSTIISTDGEVVAGGVPD